MVKLKDEEKVSILDRGSKPKKSTQQSALITNPENRYILVAKVRDDLMALEKANFFVLITEKENFLGLGEINIRIVAPREDCLEFISGSFVYNGKKIT